MAPDLFIPPEHRRVLNALEGHVGKANAISQADLAEAAGLPPRQVRTLINQLIVDLKRPVCSAYGGAGQAGYYLPANDSEALAAARALELHALKILRRASVLKKTSLDITLSSLPRLAREEAA